MKTGLVLEGGAMRGIFTAGVLDYLLDKDIYFDYVVGVSAGSGNAVNFVSRQKERTRKVIMHEGADESYYGMSQVIEHKKLLNTETLVQEYALKDIPYDFDAYFASETDNESVVLNCETGCAEYPGNYKDKDMFFKCNMASCSVPFICEPIEINGNHYLDGSIMDSIPVARAEEKGCDRILVVMTKPEGSSPTDYSKMKRMVEHHYRNYPNLCKALLERKDNYKKQAAKLNELVKEGKAMVIRPSEQMIGHFVNDMDKLMAFYDFGYKTMEEKFEEFKRFVSE